MTSLRKGGSTREWSATLRQLRDKTQHRSHSATLKETFDRLSAIKLKSESELYIEETTHISNYCKYRHTLDVAVRISMRHLSAEKKARTVMQKHRQQRMNITVAPWWS